MRIKQKKITQGEAINEARVETHPGHLITIESEAEQTLAVSLCTAAGGIGAVDNGGCWIGLEQIGKPELPLDNWQWVTDTKLAGQYSAWAEGEPDNRDDGETAARLDPEKGGGWGAIEPDNDDVRRYIVEYE